MKYINIPQNILFGPKLSMFRLAPSDMEEGQKALQNSLNGPSAHRKS